MAYAIRNPREHESLGIENLRQQNLFGGYDNSESPYNPNQDMGYEPSPREVPGQDVLGPDGQPLDQTPSPIQTPTIEAPRVDPNANRMTLEEWFDAANKGYTPQTYARDRFNNVIDQFPERKQPSGIMRWAAGLQGVSQVGRQGGNPAKTVDDILNFEGNRAIDDWKTRIDPYHKAATLEGTANTQERQLASGTVAAYMREQALAETARNNDMRNEASMIRARAYAYSQQLGRGWEWDLKGPTAKKFNKTTGEIIDTGLPTGKMDEQLRIELQNEGRIEAARQLGSNQVANAAANPGQFYVVDGVPHTYDPVTRKLRPVEIEGRATGAPPPKINKPGTEGTSGGGKTSQLEQRRIESDKLRDLYRDDPDAREVITRKGNEYVWKDRPKYHEDTWVPGDHVPQETVDKYDETRKRYDPTYKPPAPKGIGPSSSATPPPPPAATPPQSRGAGGMFDQESGVDAGDNYAPEGKAPASSRSEKDAKVASGKALYAIDKNGKIVGIVGNNAAGRAEAARMGYTTRGR